MAGVPTTFTYPNGLLIANYLTGTSDGTPQPTQVAGVSVASVLEIQSTSGSLLLPRMTTAQKNALAPVSNGMMVYDLTLNQFQGYENGAWGNFGGGNVNGPQPSTTNAVAVFGNNLGNTLLNTLVTLNPITAIISGIANAVSGAGTNVAPTYTFAGDTDTGMFLLGANTIGFGANGGTNFAIDGAFPNSVNYFTVTGGDVNASPELIALGADANISVIMQTKGLGDFSFVGSSNTQLSVGTNATGVNYLNIQSGSAGQPPVIDVFGTDLNAPLLLRSRGTGSIVFKTNGSGGQVGAGLNQFNILNTASAVNVLNVTGSVTTSPVKISATGTDADIGISLITKGLGAVTVPSGGIANPGFAFATSTTTGLSYDGPTARINFSNAGNLIAAITSLSVLRLGTPGAANNATNTLVMQFGTAPNNQIANTVQAYCAQATGAVNTLGIFGDPGVVTVVNPTAPNRTIAIVANGTTYYLAAKTTND